MVAVIPSTVRNRLMAGNLTAESLLMEVNLRMVGSPTTAVGNQRTVAIQPKEAIPSKVAIRQKAVIRQKAASRKVSPVAAVAAPLYLPS